MTAVPPALRLLALAAAAGASILSVSDVKKCYRRSSGSDCREKLVVLGHLGGESLETIMMDSIVAQSGNHSELKLAAPVEIRVRKQESYVYYNLEPLRQFNAQPTEHVGYHAVASCEAGSCGHYTDERGEVIPYSTGFCCDCSKSEMFGWKEMKRRGDPGCSIADSATMSHCMRMSDRWFQGSRIATARQHMYSLAVEVARDGEVLGEFELSPSQTHNTVAQEIEGADFAVTATVIGNPVVDVTGSAGSVVDLETGRVLLSATDGSGDILQVPESYVTLDGRECDKIGVSFEAFYSQSERCFKTEGDCLHNQIEDILKDERIRMATGFAPRYVVSGESFAKGDGMVYSAVDTDYLMTIELTGGSVFFDIPVSAGRIVNASAAAFEVTGVAEVSVVNVGELASAFKLSLESDVRPSGVAVAHPTREFDLAPGEVRTELFVLKDLAAVAARTDSAGGSPGGVALIVVRLYDAEGGLTNSTTFNATTTGYAYGKGVQGGAKTEVNDLGGNEGGDNRGDHPFDFSFDFFDFSSSGCGNPITCAMRVLILLVAVVVVGYVVFTIYKYRECLKCCCRCCASESGPAQEKQQRDAAAQGPAADGELPPDVIIPPMIGGEGVENPLAYVRNFAPLGASVEQLKALQKQMEELQRVKDMLSRADVEAAKP